MFDITLSITHLRCCRDMYRADRKTTTLTRTRHTTSNHLEQFLHFPSMSKNPLVYLRRLTLPHEGKRNVLRNQHQHRLNMISIVAPPSHCGPAARSQFTDAVNWCVSSD